jgi:hypothetical protein
MNVSLLDTRIAYGARCTWWDGIRKVGKTPPGPGGFSVPCCPHCSGVLFEMANEGQWLAGVDKYESAGHPGYRAMVEWGRGKCFSNYAELKRAYDTAEPSAPKGGPSTPPPIPS